MRCGAFLGWTGLDRLGWAGPGWPPPSACQCWLAHWSPAARLSSAQVPKVVTNVPSEVLIPINTWADKVGGPAGLPARLPHVVLLPFPSVGQG